MCLVLFLINPVHADSSSIPEVRALYLYNFSMFIHWPDKAFPTRNSPIRYCVLGGRVLRRTLARLLENETVKGRPLVLEPLETPIDASHCHLLYMDDTLADNEGQLITALENQPVLTVGASRNFPHNGGMIGLVRKGRRIRPLVNMKAVERSGIRISSKLLQLSTLLKDDEVVKSP
ncbi:YfiR family protein [Thiolapillus brandeum]|uniref:YfiR family protein n=1 Tax=Thiolapillus brandeum TaxID=1076588 RepID=UPI00155A7149|nr:YfiR family protein [Thiolapillus brandeum]